MCRSHTSSSDSLTRTKSFPISLNHQHVSTTWKTLTQTQIQRQEPNTDTSIHASDVLTSTTLVKRESIVNVQYVPCKYLTKGFVDYHVDELIRRRNWPTHFICLLLSHTTATTHTSTQSECHLKHQNSCSPLHPRFHLPLDFTHNCKH